MKLAMIFLCIALHCTENSYSQSKDFDSKNSLDIQLLGNKGFVAIGYNRTIFKNEKIEWLIGPAIGYVPASREDTANSVPRFLHLNLGSYIVYGKGLLRPNVGVSYSKILLGDPYNARPKNNYNRVLGDIGVLIRVFDLSIKIAYAPILFDDGADDVQNFPLAVVIHVTL